MNDVSLSSDVSQFYDKAAVSYAEMMDAEINLPMYTRVLESLSISVKDLSGPIIDTACGPGHMLGRYSKEYGLLNELIGRDLSPEMISLAKEKQPSSLQFSLGNMLDLTDLESHSAAALINYFALHHLDSKQVSLAFQEWARVLKPKGVLFLGLWEGQGPIDYGSSSDMVAMNYSSDYILTELKAAGFVCHKHSVETIEDMGMDALYCEATLLSSV